MAYKGQPIVTKIGQQYIVDSDFFDNLIEQMGKDISLQQIAGLLNQLVQISSKESQMQQLIDLMNQLINIVSKEETLQNILSLLNAVKFLNTIRVDSHDHLKTYITDFVNPSSTGTWNLLTPSTGKSIVVREWYLSTSATGGEMWLKFANSGQVIGALYVYNPGDRNWAKVNIKGAADEPIVIEMDGVTSNRHTLIIINYYEV